MKTRLQARCFAAVMAAAAAGSVVVLFAIHRNYSPILYFVPPLWLTVAVRYWLWDPKDSAERRLDELDLQNELHEVTPEEYATKRQEILKDL